MRILHVFRTPVGGLFRYVRDLTRQQQALGHEVGILCDSSTGGETAVQLLNSVAPACGLGIVRFPISRLPGVGDLSGARQATTHARRLKPDIIHCHGAKGGLYGRLAASRLGVPSVYTPHGGSLHYSWSSPAGAVFLSAERFLHRVGSGLIFVCAFERDSYDRKIGIGGKPHAVIYNGLLPEEFADAAPRADAADVLFIGDMRVLKGVDVLLEALARLRHSRTVSACLVGDGPDLERFKALAAKLELNDRVVFPGRMGARAAFERGRLLVMPSRAESFPYVVLEATAAGVPMIASAVGGIPEVLPRDLLVAPGDAGALADRLAAALTDRRSVLTAAAATRERLRRDFTVAAMTKSVTDFYATVMPQR